MHLMNVDMVPPLLKLSSGENRNVSSNLSTMLYIEVVRKGLPKEMAFKQKARKYFSHLPLNPEPSTELARGRYSVNVY